MQEWVRQELRDLGFADAKIHEMEETSERIPEYLKDEGTMWRKDTRTDELVFEYARYNPCHEVWMLFEKRYAVRDYVSEWELRRQYHLTSKQYDRLGQAYMSAARVNADGKMVYTSWWPREKVDALTAPKLPVQGTLF